MREFKFRVWFNVPKEMDYPRSASTALSYIGLDDVVVEQWTGLQDKNGKDIYEGDILETKVKGRSISGPMFWDESRDGWSDFRPLKWFEVIGNIHE